MIDIRKSYAFLFPLQSNDEVLKETCEQMYLHTDLKNNKN